MTAQASDIVTYQGVDYCIAGIDGDGLFDPSRCGMTPVSWCTACWRGYLTHYQVEDGQLRLNTLQVCLTEPSMGGQREVEKVEAPAIEGRVAVDVSDEEHSMFEYRYENMALPVAFTGGLLLAADFIRELYVHMGFHPAWKYRRVHELLFKKGRLTSSSDVSQKMAEFRSEMSDAGLRPGLDASTEKLMAWIARCFSRDYKL